MRLHLLRREQRLKSRNQQARQSSIAGRCP
nr:MAG TPA: hypothetical protein [Caudoviricetes sp.]